MINFVWFLDILLSSILLLPVKDERGRYRSFPVATTGLILTNVAIFLLLNLGLQRLIDDVDEFRSIILPMLLLPAAIVQGQGLGALSVITASFMHGGWFHLIGNMFYLFFFGRKLEDVLGLARFIVFYLVCAFVSSVVSVISWTALPLTQGQIPSLGASGAIMGVVGAYLFLYSEQQIKTLVMIGGIIPIPYMTSMPAWVFILYTIVSDLANGWLQQVAESVGFIYSLINSFAHLGGVLAGLTCLYFFLPRELLHYRYRVET
ncbi:MAG TPA: rhomboid family intramembrane serine protease [Chloroflexi bacterium]|nr:rhomboid family intramembrane serine protease [Chloroflexota bacterium]